MDWVNTKSAYNPHEDVLIFSTGLHHENRTRFEEIVNGFVHKLQVHNNTFPVVFRRSVGGHPRCKDYRKPISASEYDSVWEEVMLHVSSPPVVNSEFRKITATKGARLALAVPIVMANPTPSFQWRLNGVDIPGAVSQQYDIEGASEADVGTYTCVLENLAGMAIWEETIVELQA